jgi:hypothetical protein
VLAGGESQLIINYDAGTGNFTYLNDAVGTGIFYSAGYLGRNTVIANVEAGHIWFDHDAFNRPADASPDLMVFTGTAGTTNEVDFHATMVGHVLAGTGYVPGSDPASFYFAGIGVAPYAALWSGSVATSYSATTLGAFTTTPASTLEPYRAFFGGINGQQADVINSSWGFPDPAGTEPETVAIDALAAENPAVALVVSAGNGETATPGGPSSGFNSITVGSVGGPDFRDPSAFSSRGPGDFINPETGKTFVGSRALVDLVAPGESLVLAAYLGDSGSFGASSDPDTIANIQDPPPKDQYFLSVDGTSFSAPIVAGGVALLKDVAKSPLYQSDLGAEALDTRVIKAALMASADATTGWDNGQTAQPDGVIRTTQSLDFATGAGVLDLEGAAAVYVFGTTDVGGSGGGAVETLGWDLATVQLATGNDYTFTDPFAENVELTLTVNWFAGREFDPLLEEGTDVSFADLNLEIWQDDGLGGRTVIAESVSLHNNVEFLRLTLTQPGTYGFTVRFDDMIYDLSDSVNTVDYGVAWQAVAVPEPGTASLFLAGGLGLLTLRRVRASARDRRPGRRKG